MQFPNLFSPFRIKNTVFRNRIFSTGHDTYLPEGGLPSPALIAYQEARAKGGAGLIIIQVVGVHESARYTEALLMGTDDACIPKFRELIGAIQAHGTSALVQLFHPGRELFGRPEGVVQPAYAPSCAPSERFRTVPRALSLDLIAGNHRRLWGERHGAWPRPAPMASKSSPATATCRRSSSIPRVNLRSDRYGGTLENRLRFTREVIAAIRRSGARPISSSACGSPAMNTTPMG